MNSVNTAIEQIWTAYHANLRGYIRSRVNDPTVVDDILQDVFVKIQSGIGTLKDTSKIKPWIYRITRNSIIDHYRTRKKLEQLPEGLVAPETDAGDQARQDVEGCLLPMIQRLPDDYRQALMLSEIEELTQKQVAEKLEISLSGAKSRVQRGRRMIKEMLLACCRFEFDRRGSMVDYEVKGSGCDIC
jgi:RNA polymerase sigma-70 factor (ECF subfamily)